MQYIWECVLTHTCVLTHYILVHVPVAMAQNDKEKGGRGGREVGENEEV